MGKKIDRMLQFRSWLQGQPRDAAWCVLINADPKYKLREGGCLADIVPTLIELMGEQQPAEMTGKSLLTK